MAIEEISGGLCIDEPRLGRFTLPLAADPISELPVAFALASRNDKKRTRRFLSDLKGHGSLPRVVVTDGSDLYPAVLAQPWPQARHRLCVSRPLKGINDHFLVVKNASDLDRQQWDGPVKVFGYQPELRALWHFACEARGLLEGEARVRALWERPEAPLGNDECEGVPELVKAMGMLGAGKYTKAVAFAYGEAAEKVRTNDHVEGANRKSRFAEKSR
jgi:hypothetical protein